MELRANGWHGLKSVTITRQQAEDIVNGPEELRKLRRAANVKVCCANTGGGLAVLENQANLVRGPDEKYRVVGTAVQVQYILDQLAKGRKGLTMTQATEAKAKRGEQIRNLAERQRRKRRLAQT